MDRANAGRGGSEGDVLRLSPSAALRGHGAALDLGRALVRKLEADGHRVINGSEAFEYELSKLRQQGVLRQLGLHVPKTVVLTPGSLVPPGGFDVSYPAILKPDTGGSGAGVTVVSSGREAFEHLHKVGDRGESWLLQEKIESRDGSILRLELIGDRLVYAMRVRAVNTFNLCPAEACERPPADASLAVPPEVLFEHESHPEVELVDAARRVLSATGLEVGGVEIMIERSGRPVFIDVNATSVYRRDMAAAANVDPFAMLAEHLREVGAERRCA